MATEIVRVDKTLADYLREQSQRQQVTFTAASRWLADQLRAATKKGGRK